MNKRWKEKMLTNNSNLLKGEIPYVKSIIYVVWRMYRSPVLHRLYFPSFFFTFLFIKYFQFLFFLHLNDFQDDGIFLLIHTNHKSKGIMKFRYFLFQVYLPFHSHLFNNFLSVSVSGIQTWIGNWKYFVFLFLFSNNRKHNLVYRYVISCSFIATNLMIFFLQWNTIKNSFYFQVGLFDICF